MLSFLEIHRSTTPKKKSQVVREQVNCLVDGEQSGLQNCGSKWPPMPAPDLWQQRTPASIFHIGHCKSEAP